MCRRITAYLLAIKAQKNIPRTFNLSRKKIRRSLFFIVLISVLVVTFNIFGTCLSFLPYGYNGFFVHLPIQEQFCVASPDGNTFYTTDARGARIIIGEKLEEPIYAFGESQLLEIFPNPDGKGHALQSLYENKTLNIHAAPNNGPFESVEYLKYILRTTSPKKIVIGFNFGTDVFRIIPGWKTKNHVSLDGDQLSTVMLFPFWYEIKVLLGTIKGKYFSSNYPNIDHIRNYYMSQKILIRKNFETYITLLNKAIKSNLTKVDFIFFPPYWAYSQNGKTSYLEKNYGNEFNKFVCEDGILNPLLVTQVYIAKFPDSSVSDKLFTYDKRHFRTKLLTFKTKENYCVKS